MDLTLINKLQGEENAGMAMTFTLVSHLSSRLSSLVRLRAENKAKAEMEKERLAIEVSDLSIFPIAYTDIAAYVGRGGSYTRYTRDYGVLPSVESKIW